MAKRAVVQDPIYMRLCLDTTVAIYSSHADKWFFGSQRRELQDIGSLLREEFPRALFEKGFLSGERSYIESALEINPDLQPEKKTDLHVILPVKGRRTSLEVAAIRYEKSDSEISWQRWRLPSIDDDSLKDETFPPHNGLLLYNVSEIGGTLRSNVYKSRGENMTYQFQDKTGRSILVELVIGQVVALPQPFNYRFRYSTYFAEQLTPEDLGLLKENCPTIIGE